MIRISVTSHLRSQSVQDCIVNATTFRGGEVNIVLPKEVVDVLQTSSSDRFPTVQLIANIQNSNDLMALMLTTDAIRRIENRSEISCMIPYFPYARQDRVCNPGEALSVAVAAKMINSLNFKRVIIVDPHSTVLPALLDNVIVQSQEYYLSNLLRASFEGGIENHQDLWVMAPDQGAYKKVFDVAAKHNFAGFLYAIKDRDPKTMEIMDVKIQGDVAGKDILVLDDICDGGRTFMELGRLLKTAGAKSIQLFVTHGIFSYGVDDLCKLYDKVYTTDSFHPCVEGLQTNLSLTRENLIWLAL